MTAGKLTKQSLLVPGCHKALDDMKYEIAAELGIPVHQGSEDYWGHVTTREAGIGCRGYKIPRKPDPSARNSRQSEIGPGD